RLARPVDADDQGHLRTRGDHNRQVDRGKNVADFLLDQVAQAGAVACPGLDGGDDAVGGGDADVRGDQELLERVDGVDVDGTRPLPGRIGNADELVEPFDNLLGGAGETFTNAAEETHSGDLTLTACDVRLTQRTGGSGGSRGSGGQDHSSASARCLRSMSVSRAVRTSARPASTSDIWVAIGSSTP